MNETSKKEDPMTDKTDKIAIERAARVREALERIIKCQCTICPDHGPLGCEAKHLIGLCKLIQSAREILAAPPRNCDAMTEEEAVKAFKAENCDQYENDSMDPRTCCEGRCVECVVRWMMAEHKEGGDHAKV